MSIEIVASALLVLGGLTWLGTGLLNFGKSQRQFCDLYCSLTELLPVEVVNVLFILLGVLAIGFASMLIYNQVQKPEEKKLEIKLEDSIETVESGVSAPVVAPIAAEVPIDTTAVFEEKIDFPQKEQSSSTRHFKASCCGR